MCWKLDFPLAAPSANKFEYISPTNPQHIIQNFNGGIDYILDDGNCLIGIESLNKYLELIEKIHASPFRLTFVSSGGGTNAISELLKVPGAK